MKSLFAALCLSLLASFSFAQNAVDFTKQDCSGATHHLFGEANNDTIVFLEFVMTCSTCANVGHQIEATIARLQAEYPNKSFRFYQLAYTNSYTCTTLGNWQANNNFTCPGFDSGATLVAQYGGFGMPTVAIVGGTNHQLCYNSLGYIDTAAAGTAIRNIFKSNGIANLANNLFSVSPNPASDMIQIHCSNNVTANVEIYDMNGRLQFSENKLNTALQIDTHLWNKGNYIVKFRQGTQSSSQFITLQ